MEHLLIAALFAAFLLYLYDTLVTGPSWARTLLAGILGSAGLYAQDVGRVNPHLILGPAAGFAAMLGVAVLQLCQVQRDTKMMQAFGRRR